MLLLVFNSLFMLLYFAIKIYMFGGTDSELF